MKSYIKFFIHNVIIHPIMAFLPRNLAYKIHDINGKWAFRNDKQQNNNRANDVAKSTGS